MGKCNFVPSYVKDLIAFMSYDGLYVWRGWFLHLRFPPPKNVACPFTGHHARTLIGWWVLQCGCDFFFCTSWMAMNCTGCYFWALLNKMRLVYAVSTCRPSIGHTWSRDTNTQVRVDQTSNLLTQQNIFFPRMNLCIRAATLACYAWKLMKWKVHYWNASFLSVWALHLH